MTTRRSAIKKSASAAFGFTFLPSYLATGARAQGDPLPPSKRVNLACIGVGGRGGAVIPNLLSNGKATPVAFCDIDFEHARQTKLIDENPNVPRYADFRVMFDEMADDIDAVSIVTPDHTHFPAAILAMSLGKHVYVEKPLTHTFAEAQMLMDAEKKFGVVTQMGNQGHTGMASAQFKAWVERGVVDNVSEIHAWKGPGIFFMEPDKRFSEWPAEEPIPESLNWDLWCGARPMRPYSRKIHPSHWRGFYEYGSGMLGDWGCHIIDYVHHYLELGLPTQIDAVRIEDPNDIIFPLRSHLDFTFPARSATMPEVKLHWHDGADCHPTIPDEHCDLDEKSGAPKQPELGAAGTYFAAGDGSFGVTRGSHGSSSRVINGEKLVELAPKLKIDAVQVDHGQSFIDACLGEGQTWSPFSIAAPLTQVLCLGVIAQRLNTNLSFDPATKQFANNDAANALLIGPEPRDGWKEFYEIL